MGVFLVTLEWEGLLSKIQTHKPGRKRLVAFTVQTLRISAGKNVSDEIKTNDKWAKNIYNI